MPQRRFEWDAFDEETVSALALALGYYGGASGGKREWLSQKVRRPTEDFVYATKHVLESMWLQKNPGIAKSIVDRLVADGIGPRIQPESDAEHIQFVRDCGEHRTARVLLAEALVRFGTEGSSQEAINDSIGSVVPWYARIRPNEQTNDGRQPYPYQLNAWDGMDEHMAEARHTGVFEGLLIMPTGSGKTFTAARWLMHRHLSNGGRVLWLAHRYELLEQAAQAFQNCAYLAAQRDVLRIRIVSGIHCSSSMISDSDDIVICSVASLSRRPEIAMQLLSDDNMFVVVDEAHHSPAKSYRRIIDLLRERTPRRLLGLTATPTRTITEEQPVLSRLFGGRKLFEVPIRKLIEEGFLARPYPVRVHTGSEVEKDVTDKDAQHLARFDELSAAWQQRIAELGPRNELIVRHFRQNSETYGKTLIFAINVPHAGLLCDRFQQEGIQAEYIASYRPDGGRVNNRAIVERFRDPSSGLDVLINIQMLTEGVDIPNIQTVFLTRPTRSEILVRQMIGRAMRGRAVRGTERAYLVSFEDHWERFVDWESPLDLVMDVLEESVEDELPAPGPRLAGIKPAREVFSIPAL